MLPPPALRDASLFIFTTSASIQGIWGRPLARLPHPSAAARPPSGPPGSKAARLTAALQCAPHVWLGLHLPHQAAHALILLNLIVIILHQSQQAFHRQVNRNPLAGDAGKLAKLRKASLLDQWSKRALFGHIIEAAPSQGWL